MHVCVSNTQEVPKNSKRTGSFLRGLYNAPSFPGIIDFNCLFMKNRAGVLAFGFWLLAFLFFGSLLVFFSLVADLVFGVDLFCHLLN
jgi:hypothetical protein